MKIYFSLLIFLAGWVINAQTILTIEGKTFINGDDTWNGVIIQRSVPVTLTFKNNSITSVNRYGYLLQAGDETIGSNNNHLDGAIITGNKLNWSGTDMKVIPHGIFTGCNINVLIKYNYLNCVPMAIIRKSASNMVNTSGGVAYNIVKSPNTGIVVKGMSGVCIYNNTLYQDRTTSETGRGLIDIYTNSDVTPNSVSHGTKIYNNIFYTKYETFCINIMDKESLTGFESDYNVFYCETGSVKFNAGGSVKTFKEWQALGYDTHSVVINPNFKDFVSFIPAKRLDYGKDLGSNWKEGLSVDARWGVTDPKTTIQNGTWQVGAIIYGEPENKPPVINITSPDKSASSYTSPATIIIEAIASDPDGEISKVEFFAGNTKLGEINSAPYYFNWKNVPQGTYSITGVATDNRNCKTVSDAITVTVNNLSTSTNEQPFVNINSQQNIGSHFINLYPNPTNGRFTVNLLSDLLPEENKVIITSLKGEIIYNGILFKGESSLQFDLSYLDSGNYIMMITSNNIVYTKKFVKN